MNDSVLVVEDDNDIADLIRVNLAEIGITVDHAAYGDVGLAKALDNQYELLLLDVMLPNVSGLDICREVRQRKPEQAIVMLTAKDSEMDRVLGLELGADDYLTKPFSVRELQARIRAQLRKVHMLACAVQSQDDTQATVVIGQLQICTKRRTVLLREQHVDLTATEFELLVFLAQHPNQVFSRAQLLESVWGYHHSGYEHTVNSHINRLRAKIEANVTRPLIIQTVWGVGYKLNAMGVQDQC